MFVPTQMSEVDIFVFEEDIEAVAQTVARLGVMHLLDANALGKWAEGVSTEWAGRISTYADQERRTKELLAQLGIEAEPPIWESKLNPSEDFNVFETELQRQEAVVHELRDKIAQTKHRLEQQALIAKSMETLAPLSISIADLRQLEHLHLVVGTIPEENLARLEESLFRIPYSIIPVYRYERRVLLFAFCAEEHAPILDRALESAFLDPLALPENFNGPAQEALGQITQRIEESRQELAELEKQRERMAQELAPGLLELLTRIQSDRAIAEAMSHFGHREQVYLIAGWVPTNRVAELRSAVEEAAGGRVTFEESPPYVPGASHKIPTLLKHSGLLRPFEKLVATYGVPGYREIDPTPLVGVTFVLMFGVMFGDLGHGLVLALLGILLVLRVIPALASQAETGVILLACGLFSAVFGLLYGNLFGLEDLMPALWIRPMRDIWTLLGASVVFGVIVLNIGFGCRLATAMREGRILEAIFDKNGLVGLLLYWCLGSIIVLIALGKHLPGWLDALTIVLALSLFLAEPLTRLISGVRPLVHGSIAELFVQAFFELFEALISYLSNTLSYVRLGAFAVAHAGLSTVVFLLADMLSSGPTGGLRRLLIVALGNIAIIGFEGLIVGIQTLRLEYYELFGKFYKGDGTPFKPLTLPRMQSSPNTVIKER